MGSTNSPLKIGVIGPAGFGGSYVCVELINRGHEVIGISRNPCKLGSHERYTPRAADVSSHSIEELARAFSDLDVLINEYGPHSAGHEALQYMPYLEVTRKLVLAARHAKVKYFIMVGGCGSLFMPQSGYQSVLENKDWWMAYRRGIADSEAHTSYMEERLGPMGTGLRSYRNARAAQQQGEDTEAARSIIEDYENYVRNNDRALAFITGCRASFMFFDGSRTGQYRVRFDELPLKGDENDPTNLDGRLHGISAADLAMAIADEAEQQTKQWKHWSAYVDFVAGAKG